MPKISREEILHIANLADLKLEEQEIQQYQTQLEEILNFANIVNNAPTDGLSITIGANENKNVFREDKQTSFEDKQALLQNTPHKDRNMFQIPKVIN